jgi:hypothetical protein
VLAALALFWPLPLHLTDALVTAPTGEGPEHVWRWWVAGQVGVPWGGFFSGINHPTGLTVHVVDPLNALMAGVLGWWWGGAAAGLAVVQVAGVVVGALAGHLLAEESGADRSGRILGAAAGLAIPTVVGAGLDGITEGLGLGWTGLQLALLLRLLRTERHTDLLGFAVAFGCAAWSGPYTLVFSALLDAVVGLAVLRRTRLPLLAGLLGTAFACPIIWAAFSLVDQQPGGAGRMAFERPLPVAAWRGAWREGTDLLDLLVPAWLTGEPALAPTTGYLGVVWLGVVAVGLVRSFRAGQLRAALPWLAGGLTFVVLALGPILVVAGKVVNVGTAELWAPVGFLEALPVIGRLSRWYRAAAVAVLLLVPIGARAVRGLPLPAVLGLALLIVVDARTGSPAPFPGPTIALPTVDWSVAPGPYLEIPSVHPLGKPNVVADRNLLLQLDHAQPNSGTIDARPGAATDQPGMRVLYQVAVTDPPDRNSLMESARRQVLRDGYRTLLLYPDLLPEGAVQRFSEGLGRPVEVAPGVLAIALER